MALSILSLFISCMNASQKNQEMNGHSIPVITFNIEDTDSALHFNNGYYYYLQELFSGTLMERYDDNSIHQQTTYWRGKEEGIKRSYYPNRSIAETRYYHLGEKDSVHRGWWQDGAIRFEYHFRNGQYHGDYKEWYSSGQPYKQIHYNNGVDDYGRGWRENGRVFMSYIVKNGRRYGSINANLCYTLKNEEGEFQSATKR